MFNKKKKAAAAEAEQARVDEIAALQAQLDEVNSERAALEARIATLGTTNDQLDQRLAALDHGVQSMGEQLVTLSTSSTETTRRIELIDDRVDQVEALRGDLDEINQRIQAFEPVGTPTPGPPPPPDQTSGPLEVPPPPGAALRVPVAADPLLIEFDAPDDLNERVEQLREQLDELTRQTSSIDSRVTSVSMELANQLTELGSDIDELNRRWNQPAGSGSASDVDTAELEARIAERLDVAIDDVLDSTQRLAAEQARYEIQFRSDLAELAERIRRPGSS